MAETAPAAGTPGAMIIGVTDDVVRLRLWAEQRGIAIGEPPIDLGDSRARAALRAIPKGASLALLVVAPSHRWVRSVEPALRRAERVSVVVLRGLRSSGRVDDLLEAAEQAGLEPVDVRRVRVETLAGVEVALDRDGASPLWRAAHALSLAAATTAATAPEATGPRVAIAGDAGAWVDGLAHATVVDPAWAQDPARLRRDAPDIVLLAADASTEAAHLEALAAARGAGASVLAIGPPSPRLAEHVDALAPPGPHPLPTGAVTPAEREAPLVDPTAELPADPVAAANELVARCSAGEPLVAPGLARDIADLLAPTLRQLLCAPPPELVTAADASTTSEARPDPASPEATVAILRQRHGVRLRRAAREAYDVARWWRDRAATLDVPLPPAPSVSAICPTRRPDLLCHLAAQLRRQRHRPLEAVIVAHGEAWNDVAVDLPDLDMPVEVVRAPGQRSLGAALNLGVEAASGAIVTKIDDDDWYGPDHIGDLVAALEPRRATLVGKGAEFYHLGDRDETIHRVNDRPEQASRLIAGNTLTIRRDDLTALGGFHDVDRTEDRRLVFDVLRWGGLVYRIHGFGHVVRRRGARHTWQITEAELADGARWVAPGRRLDLADCLDDAGASPT